MQLITLGKYPHLQTLVEFYFGKKGEYKRNVALYKLLREQEEIFAMLESMDKVCLAVYNHIQADYEVKFIQYFLAWKRASIEGMLR